VLVQPARAVEHGDGAGVQCGAAFFDRRVEGVGASGAAESFEHGPNSVEEIAALSEKVNDAGVADVGRRVSAVCGALLPGGGEQAG
jgi:hypothetical protein